MSSNSDARREYKDIIDLPYTGTKRRKSMSLYDRAAQFAAYKALPGYEDLITESGRYTQRKAELDEDKREQLDRRLSYIESLTDSPAVTIEYFEPDERKSGGRYCTVTGYITTADSLERTITVNGELRIPIDDIMDIRGEIFGEEV